MRVEIVESNPPKVRTSFENGTKPQTMTCADMEQARSYAAGLVDGARMLRNQVNVSGPFYGKPE